MIFVRFTAVKRVVEESRISAYISDLYPAYRLTAQHTWAQQRYVLGLIFNKKIKIILVFNNIQSHT